MEPNGMDGRYKVLRPRTRQSENDLNQSIGYLGGVTAIEQRVMDPVRTFETPLVGFPADVVVPSATVMDIPLPRNCAQIAFISVIPGVVASFNGGGARTIKDGFVYNGLFQSLQVSTDALGTCIIQLGAF